MNTISVATVDDVPALMKLADEYAREMIDNAYRWASMSYDRDCAIKSGLAAISNPNHCIFMHHDGQTIHGFIWCACSSQMWSNDLVAYDVILYVHPEHRNLNVAKALVTTFEGWAKLMGCKCIHTGAYSGVLGDRAAEALYSYLGYEQGGLNFYKEV